MSLFAKLIRRKPLTLVIKQLSSRTATIKQLSVLGTQVLTTITNIFTTGDGSTMIDILPVFLITLITYPL